MAAIAGQAHVVKCLLSSEHQAITRNAQGKNVLDLAIEHNQESVAMVIAEHER